MQVTVKTGVPVKKHTCLLLPYGLRAQITAFNCEAVNVLTRFQCWIQVQITRFRGVVAMCVCMNCLFFWMNKVVQCYNFLWMGLVCLKTLSNVVCVCCNDLVASCNVMLLWWRSSPPCFIYRKRRGVMCSIQWDCVYHTTNSVSVEAS
jgi:hypothetical protein